MICTLSCNLGEPIFRNRLSYNCLIKTVQCALEGTISNYSYIYQSFIIFLFFFFCCRTESFFLGCLGTLTQTTNSTHRKLVCWELSASRKFHFLLYITLNTLILVQKSALFFMKIKSYKNEFLELFSIENCYEIFCSCLSKK